jgi:hypothetical protein
MDSQILISNYPILHEAVGEVELPDPSISALALLRSDSMSVVNVQSVGAYAVLRPDSMRKSTSR